MRVWLDGVIAKATGFTNPALFKHFASKDALAAYLFERCYLELSHMVQAAVGSGKTFQERRRALVKAYLIALDRDPDSVIRTRFLRVFGAHYIRTRCLCGTWLLGLCGIASMHDVVASR